jgi:Tfp pilus assembly protein PilN
MTAVIERGSRAGKQKQNVSAPPLRLPQVNLLPPEVSAARGVRRTQRWLALALVVVVALCGLGWAGSLLVQNAAQDQLVQVQSDTSAIQAESLQYAEVPQVLQRLDEAEQAQQYGMAAEVLWADYVGAIVSVLPADVKIESVSSTLATPAQSATLTPDPLKSDGIGELRLIGRTATLPDTAQWIRALDALPGFADTRMSTMVVAADAVDNSSFYRVTLLVQVTPDALSGRYLPGGSQAPADAATTEGTDG